jgi:hypothetical protein
MVTRLTDGGTTTFSRECSFRGLAWVVTATLCLVPGAQWLVQIICWYLIVGGAPPCPVPGTTLSGALAEKGYFTPTALFGLRAINRGGDWPWVGC